MDTITSTGKLVFQIFGSFAEFERNVIRERTNAGLASARARGRKGVRPKLSTDAAKRRKIEVARALYADMTNSIEDICNTLHISQMTLYRWVGMEKRG